MCYIWIHDWNIAICLFRYPLISRLTSRVLASKGWPSISEGSSSIRNRYSHRLSSDWDPTFARCLQCRCQLNFGLLCTLVSHRFRNDCSHSVPKSSSNTDVKLNKISCEFTQNKVPPHPEFITHCLLLICRLAGVLKRCVRSHLRLLSWFTYAPTVYAVGLTEEDMNKPQVTLINRKSSKSIIALITLVDWHIAHLVGG